MAEHGSQAPRRQPPGTPPFAGRQTQKPNATQPSAPTRSTRFTSFMAAMLLLLISLAASVLINAANGVLLQQAVDRYVVAPGILSPQDGQTFANETLAYLSGANPDWDLNVTVGDHRLSVPQAFRAHMANVRQWVHTALIALPWAVVVALLLLALAVTGGFGKRNRSFSRPAYYAGAAVPLVLAAAIALWAYVSFDGMWAWLHQTFIQDGIFSAGEEIMWLFPLQLFSSYLPPVAVTFGLFTAGVLLLPLALWPLSRRRAARLAKNAPRA